MGKSTALIASTEKLLSVVIKLFKNSHVVDLAGELLNTLVLEFGGVCERNLKINRRNSKVIQGIISEGYESHRVKQNGK